MIKSFQHNLTQEAANMIFAEYGFKDVPLNVWSITKAFAGYGHIKLSLQVSLPDLEICTLDYTTPNMSISDDWMEDNWYFEDDESGHFYDSAEEVMEAALQEILRSEHNQEILQEFIAKWKKEKED